MADISLRRRGLQWGKPNLRDSCLGISSCAPDYDVGFYPEIMAAEGTTAEIVSWPCLARPPTPLLRGKVMDDRNRTGQDTRMTAHALATATMFMGRTTRRQVLLVMKRLAVSACADT